jgi:hypothetical protein
MLKISLSFHFAIIITLSVSSLLSVDFSFAQPVSGDPQCDNYLDREEEFLDLYEADPDNNGKQQSFQSSFKNGGPCM